MIFLLATFVCVMAVYIIVPRMIPVLRRMKAGQTIRDEGPKSHQAKSGTPTMGGLGIILGVTLGVVCWSFLGAVSGSFEKNTESFLSLWILWLIFIGHGFLGFLDDYIKIKQKRNLGLTAKGKLIGQLLLSALLVIAAFQLGRGTEIFLPGYSHLSIDLGWIGFSILVALVLIGTSNAVNLTDGLDGLAAGVTVCSSLSLALIAYFKGFAAEAAFGFLLGGACFAFLKYNRNPAQIFMGDTGSLALGGGLGAMVVLMKIELLWIFIGGVYVAEAISVMIQVFYFKITKGKRFFRMSPIHHHFELGGWSEKKVVHVFWLIAACLGLVGFWIGLFS